MKTEIKRTYYSDGQLRFEIPWKNGKKHGMEKSWYENGQIKYKVPCKNGKIDGIVKYWYENGLICWIQIFENDKLIRGANNPMEINGEYYDNLFFLENKE